ncbi:hypothetical protein SKAU_G00333500 [Synaphobranchus kaupii]|uniref:G-protein coupled receptors family 1 profile domain-containing protein n=1 Tax=Synaphobranchus kaupii TaxID=118154 RepID=A0A9Q1ELH8_SYNKA|nr:hypothetical protein SKAU_G00333500 [Synaphobranchus kaupii]
MRMNDTENTSDYYFYNYDNFSPCGTEATLTQGPGFQSALLFTVFFLGVIGNVVVLWVQARFIKLKSLTDVCLLNLAISDLLMALSLPLWEYRVTERGLAGSGLCKVTVGIYQISLYSGLLFVCLMSVDRYLAIVHAVAAMRARTLRYGVIASVLIWTTSICAALPKIIFTAVSEEEGVATCGQHYPNESAKTFKLLSNFGENTVVLVVSLPIMLFCYSRILAVLLRTRNSNKHRAMKLVFAIVGLFVVSWVPYSVVVFLITLGELDIWNECEAFARTSVALEITESITLAHCCVNPIIYAFVGEKFRMHLRHMLSRIPICAPFCQLPTIHSKVSENETSNTTV